MGDRRVRARPGRPSRRAVGRAPAAFASAGIAAAREVVVHAAVPVPDIAEQWLSADDWANFREWAQHPDIDAVIADLERDDSLTPALNWYRANITPAGVIEPPLELPPMQAPTMGVWSTGDFAARGADDRLGKVLRATFRYERIDGPGHWMQLEAPDKVNALLARLPADSLTTPPISVR